MFYKIDSSDSSATPVLSELEQDRFDLSLVERFREVRPFDMSESEFMTWKIRNEIGRCSSRGSAFGSSRY